MNCYDCALEDTTAPAVAVCDRCGRGVCARHAHAPGRLPGRPVPRTAGAGPDSGRRPARRVTCRACREAESFDPVRSRPGPGRDRTEESARTGPSRRAPVRAGRGRRGPR
ncbi:hypothetical protein GCM10010389_58560 [Streptomyces echinoruber]|uniref:DUF2180 family protein n=1 Tax=Streptomyces echinoruber TaxID=68898 RepID=A0A918RUV4_9ACTN|nr:hypothetical protein GCM10010389_58560 [Streptomyces echinoruber]